MRARDASPLSAGASREDRKAVSKEPCATESDEPSFSCSAEAARLIDARSAAASRAAKQHKRERIALAVFAVLVIAGFVLLTSYISNAGRGLNVAATSIDDVAGDMSGYDVVIFDGTVRKGDSSLVADEKSGAQDKGIKPILIPSASGKTSSETAGASAEDEQADVDEQVEDAQAPYPVDESRDGEMTMEEARAVYEGKKASVIEVDSESLRDFVSGRIVMKDGHTYGFFSIPSEMTADFAMPTTTMTKTTTTTTITATGESGEVDEKTTTRVKSAYGSVAELFAAVDPASIDLALVNHIEDVLARFKAARVDTVVAFTSDPTPFSAVSGVDAVITFKTSDRFSMSEVIGGTLYFDAPEEGSVGVLMIAPGNVASTKVLTEE
ncbi:MAG: hypothetical protein Q4E80_06400 [Slackia faecicanis]|nr:hypothetical protein [Slackia faecicanis]